MLNKHLSQFGTLVKCQIKKLKMNSTHFTTMANNFRGPPTVVSARRSIEDIHESLSQRIKRIMPWDAILTRDALTQVSESKYQSYIRQAIFEEGGVIGSLAGSQSSKDIREVRYPEINETLDYEAKKINGKRGEFCLNDTLPPRDSNVYYIFLRIGGHSVNIRKASDLVNDEYVTPGHYSTALDDLTVCVERLRSKGNSPEVSNFHELFRLTVKVLEVAVKSRMMSHYEYGQLFKFTTNFGFFKSRPRPNHFLHSDILDKEDRVPLKRRKDVIKEIEEFFKGSWPRKNSEVAKHYENYCTKNDNLKKLNTFLESLTQQSSE